MLSRKQWITSFILLCILGFLFLLPFYWIVTTSLKSDEELYTKPWGLPDSPQWRNYPLAWQKGRIGQAFINSSVVTGISMLMIIVAASMGAYAFSRIKFLGRILYLPILLSLVLPMASLLIPLFYTVNKLGLTDSLFGLILPYAAINTPFAMFILAEFFSAIPKSLEESACLDGASRFQIFYHLILPISWQALCAVAVLTFLFIWTEFSLALTVVTNKDLYTVPLALVAFRGAYSYDYPRLFAGTMLASFPLLIAYVFLQRSFIRGITAGAFK